MISLGKYKKEYAKKLYNTFREFYNLSTLFAGALKELCSEITTDFSLIIISSFDFLSLILQYDLIELDVILPLDLFFEIIKRISTTINKITKEHEILIVSLINFASQIGHRSVTEYDNLLKTIIKSETSLPILISCVKGLAVNYKHVYKKVKTSIQSLTKLREAIKECYSLITESFKIHFEKAKDKINEYSAKNLIESLLSFDCDVIIFDIGSVFLDYLLVIAKAEKSISSYPIFEAYINALQNLFIKINMKDIKISNHPKKQIDLLKIHSIKFLLIPLIKNCVLFFKLNRCDIINLKVATKVVECLNKNDEYILYKLFTHYVFNINITPEFKAIKPNLIA